MNRRDMLKSVAVAGIASVLPDRLLSQNRQHSPRPRASGRLLQYLQSLARPDGGYAWADQDHSHLTPTFAVIGCYGLLQLPPPEKDRLAAFVRTHHPAQLKKLEQDHRWFEFQQVQALIWLGAEISDFADNIRSWTGPLAYMKAYEQHGCPVFQSEMAAIRCRELLRLGDVPRPFIDYLNSRRRPNGSFNNTPAADGSDGHVVNTWWGLQVLDLLGRTGERKEETIAWLRACQLPSGGFTLQPNPQFGGVDDLAYTQAAIRALERLGAEPSRRDACVRYLHSLATADGGFSDRPDWLSNPVATYCALDALDALGALESLAEIRPRVRPPRPVLSPDLRVFSIQIEAHGQGSPAEAVALASALRIHLWGAKNAKPGWIDRAQTMANAGRVPVTFFVANEEYGTWVDVPGLGTYSHTSDLMAPAGRDIGPALASQGPVSWPEFRQQRLAPLLRADGRLLWQFGENEALVRLFLDDSIERGGYAAISTFHFGNPDFTNSEPFLHRWRGQIPYIALQDAHGGEPWWWSDVTTGFRTVFLATEPTWSSWLHALKQNWVVAVRHDAASGFQTWMHSGSDEVLRFVKERERDWRWWDTPEVERPLLSVVALTPQDTFEVARPEQGLTVRVRCAWDCTVQGLLKKPITELVHLAVDDRIVIPTLAAPKARRGGLLSDHYHHHQLADPAPGNHTATATARVIATGELIKKSIRFKT